MSKNVLLKGVLVVSVLLVCFGSQAQNTRNVDTPKQPKPQYQAYKKQKRGVFSFLKKKDDNKRKTNKEELIAFRKRVSDNYKANAKVEQKVEKVKKKEAKKGELFLGHKRPPKKRPPGKQKWCDICRIKH